MKTITCKLSERLDAQLAAAAHAEGISKSEVVRNALEDRLIKTRKKKSPTVYDLVGHLSGTVKGPADLLTNPKYMENFGK